MFLLDINILIALADPDHMHHARAVAFFPQAMKQGWATCPLTENGFLRILGNPKFPNGPGSPQLARPILDSFCVAPGHQFWADAITLRDLKLAPVLSAQNHLTDQYLLALAIHRKGRLATLDEHMDAKATPGGTAAYFVIP
ncbi:MAG: hypothetical protein RL693_2381 [Verrucomicrobiota bacterium]